jgi:signal peptidase II
LSKLSKWAIVAIVLSVCVGCDQATKAIARTSLSHSEPFPLLNGMVTLEYAENVGAFLGLGASLPYQVRWPLGIVSTSLLIAIAIVFMLKTHHISRPQLLSLSLLVGGGIGNLIDRIHYDGAVVDFVVLSVGPLHTGIFNIADVAIVFGALAFALFGLSDRPENTAASAQESDSSQ